MADNTKIEWCDSSWNPWIGCTKVSPGCDNCYAEADFDLRKHRVKWGTGNPRSRTSSANWKKPLQWNRQHSEFFAEHGRRRRVFCASLADVFDNEVPSEWRADLFALIADTPNLDWLILTKRVGNVLPMIRLALEFIDKAHSTGYDNADEASTARASSLRGGFVGRIGDRQAGPSVASEEKNIRPLDGRGEDDHLQTCSGGDGHGRRLFSGSPDARWQAGGGSSSSAGVASLQRADSGWADHQPQERQQGEQQAEQLGVGDLQRSEAPRDSGTGCEAPRCTGVEAPEDASERVGRDRDANAAQEQRDDKGNRSRVRCDAERSLADLPQRDLDARPALRAWLEAWAAGQPPANVWLGATVVNQAEADRDIHKLLAVPAAVRWLSMEPLLGRVDLCETFGMWWNQTMGVFESCHQSGFNRNPNNQAETAIDWVVVGCESGTKARPMHPAWARSLRDQCAAAGVPFFMKQLSGERGKPIKDIAAFPIDLQVREYPNALR